MNAPLKKTPKPGKPLNICGIVVHLAPHAGEGTLNALAALPGVEIVGQSDEGRLAVTAIDTTEALAIDQITAMHRLPGVVAASLAYHVFEGETATPLPVPAAPLASLTTASASRA